MKTVKLCTVSQYNGERKLFTLSVFHFNILCGTLVFFTIIPPHNVLHSVTKINSVIHIVNVDKGSKF